MTYETYSIKDAKLLEERRAMVRETDGLPPETDAEKDRLWRLLTDSARS
jgi:hypothetical protein